MESGKEIQISQSNELSTSPDKLIEMAIQSNASAENLKMILDLKFEWDREQAKHEYDKAMVGLFSEMEPVLKTGSVNYGTKKGGQTSYTHTERHHEIEVLRPLLSKYKLFPSWRQNQDQDGRLKVTCKITHADGHSEETTLIGPADTSGNKNPLQALGSSNEYLMRYTFESLLGIAKKGADDDGNMGDINVITDEQAADLQSLIVEVNANEQAFLKYFKIRRLEDMKQCDIERAIKSLEAKRK